jgi:hypothetical protein
VCVVPPLRARILRVRIDLQDNARHRPRQSAVAVSALFGRQRIRGHHQTTGTFYKTKIISKYNFTSQIHRSGNPDRSRNVVVPNLGGFAGISFRYSDAKISLGYRGDFFFGAMDGGIDTRKSENLGFHGPYASISVGLGD